MDDKYSFRYAKNDESDNFDVDENDAELKAPKKDIDNYDDYGDDFGYQTGNNNRRRKAVKPEKSNKDYDDGFDSQTGENRREYSKQKNDTYSSVNRKNKGKNKKGKKNNTATIATVVSVLIIVVCVLAFVLSKCNGENKKPMVTTAPSTTKATVTTQKPTVEYYEPETTPVYVPEITENVEETTLPLQTEAYTEPSTEIYTEAYTEPETYETEAVTEPYTEYTEEETIQFE